MRSTSRLFLFAILPVSLLAACADDSSESASFAGDGERSGAKKSASMVPGEEGASASDGAFGAGSASSSGTGLAPAGVLTAGLWDDNRNLERFIGYRASVVAKGTQGILPFDEAAHRAAGAALTDAFQGHQRLDVSLVIDTTGSMGDEIAYLKSEFLAMHGAIAQRFPASAQRWSLVDYKDTTDEYVVRWFNFREDAGEYLAELQKASANGGGDFPEAPEVGLDTSSQLNWRAEGDVAKIVFWVADAPHHTGNEQAFKAAIDRFRAKGVHVYPIASSGIDEFTELTMRSTAQLTGGRYVFLTNDSGVGGDHKEPSIPCYFVTKLNDAILRVVDIELAGKYHEPAASEIIRVGGDPKDGTCSVGGSVLRVF